MSIKVDPPVEFPDEIQVANLKGCARCTLDHENVTFTKMALPIDDMPYWAPCPMNGDPILLQVSVQKVSGDPELEREAQAAMDEAEKNAPPRNPSCTWCVNHPRVFDHRRGEWGHHLDEGPHVDPWLRCEGE